VQKQNKILFNQIRILKT